METLKMAWAFLSANKKVFIPIACVVALILACSISYTAGCVKGMSCNKAAEEVK